MDSLLQIKNLQNSEINSIVEKRLREFSSFKTKSDKEWFQELCFCILAANSKQKTAESIQKNLGEKLLIINEKELAEFIKNNKHRFHNNKAKYIVEARNFKKIKSLLRDMNKNEARPWLIKNIKGLGMKESSHFLRNTGSKNLAILDRHIINFMSENNLIEKPKTLTPKIYLKIEQKFISIAKNLNISPAKLDLLIWYFKTGEVAK